MIEFYAARSPNGRKISIMLEECGAPYRVHFVNLEQGDQFKPEFRRINPNSKIPAIIDDGGEAPVTVFESAPIAPDASRAGRVYQLDRLAGTGGTMREHCDTITRPNALMSQYFP
jgi:GST-like protein